MPQQTGSPLTGRLVESLYAEAMLLADETRAYFDRGGATSSGLTPALRVALSCEALQGTTRLMQVLAWLLTRKAIEAGELPEGDPRSPQRRLGEAPAHVPVVGLPTEALRLLAAGADLYDRVARLDQGIENVETAESPARSLLQRLERSL